MKNKDSAITGRPHFEMEKGGSGIYICTCQDCWRLRIIIATTEGIVQVTAHDRNLPTINIIVFDLGNGIFNVKREDMQFWSLAEGGGGIKDGKIGGCRAKESGKRGRLEAVVG